MKNLKLFSLLMFVAVSFAFASCEKKEVSTGGGRNAQKELAPEDIEGDWYYQSRSEVETYSFDNGYYYNYKEDASGYIEDDGSYDIKDGKLVLYSSYYPTEKLSISLKGDVLTIDGREFEKD